MDIKLFSYSLSRGQWIGLAIGIKLILGLGLLFLKGYPSTSLRELVCTGDCEIGYIPATFNILHHGQYTIYENLAPYAGRLPGYELVLILASLFTQGASINFWFVIILQSIVAGLSVYYLAALGYRIFPQKAIFLITYFLYSISSYNTLLDIFVLTESLAISLFIIAFYYLLEAKSFTHYLGLGVLLLFTVLLRQYILPFYGLWILYMVYMQFIHKKSLSLLLPKVIALLIPLLVFDVIWVIRNYQIKGKFIPLVDSIYAGYDAPAAQNSGFYFSEKMKASANFVKAWGGDFIWWNPKAEIRAFYSAPPIDIEEKRRILRSFPDYIYTSVYNQDSLLKLQDAYVFKQLDEAEIISRFETYQKSFKQEKPFYYGVVAPAILFRKFLFHSGTYNLFNQSFGELNWAKKLIKLGYILLYQWVVWGGFLGMFLAFYRHYRNPQVWVLLGTALYIVLLVVFVLRRIEYRHFAFSFPYFVIACSFLLNQVQQKFITNSSSTSQELSTPTLSA